MSESTSTDLRQSNDEDLDYRTVEPWAVGGLLGGLASAIALVGGPAVMVALGAVVVNLIALARIRREPSRSGRGAALLGLGLATMFAMAPIAQRGATHVLLSRQARPIADQWFEDLRQDRPERALRLQLAAEMRPPLDDSIWLHYRHDDESRYRLIKFVRDPLVRTLLALGDRAQVRFYETRSAVSDGELGGVHYIYTVTYPDAEGKKTFFVSLLLERNPNSKPGINPWRIKAYFPGQSPNA
jgi:hypothetical protein